MVLARNHQIFQWVVILLNQLTALLSRQFTIIRWSISYTPNLSYRPHLGSHEVSKMDMERQAPDTRHQAPYLPDTCLVCVTICHRHLDLTISWCEDSRCFPPEVSWDGCLESDGMTESEIMKYYNGQVWLHHPIVAHLYLGIMTPANMSPAPCKHNSRSPESTWCCPPGRSRNKYYNGQVWLHHPIDQLWNDSTHPIGLLEMCCQPRTWWCNNVTALAGYAIVVRWKVTWPFHSNERIFLSLLGTFDPGNCRFLELKAFGMQHCHRQARWMT